MRRAGVTGSPRTDSTQDEPETYNPWSVVNLVFTPPGRPGPAPGPRRERRPRAAGRRPAARARHRAGRGGQPGGHARRARTPRRDPRGDVRASLTASSTGRPSQCETARRAADGLAWLDRTTDAQSDKQGVADESPKRGQGSREDPGAGLGAALPRAGLPVRDRLHVPEGQEEGPAQAGPPVVLPDAGGEGPPGLRRLRRRDPRQHVPPGPGALAGVAEAVPEHHPAAGDLGGPGDAAAVPHRAQPGAAQRPGDPDDRRGHGTRRSSRTSSACT